MVSKICIFYCIIFLTSYAIYHSDCVNVLPEYYLDVNAAKNGACGKVITSENSVYIRSQIGAGLFGGLNSYDANQNCETIFQADNGLQVLVQFPFFKLQEPDGNNCLDKVILEENTVICKEPVPFVSSTNRLKIKFRSDGSVQDAGFTLLLTAFKSSPCNAATEFLCDTNRCISKTLTCDGVNHCLDKTDETKEHASCSELADIAGKVTGLGKNVVLGIIVIAAGILFMIVVVIMIMQFMDKDSQSCCTQTSEDEESQVPKNIETKKSTSAPVPSQSNKQKKTVTIVTEQQSREKVVGKKRSGIRKVAPSKAKDDEW